MNLAVIALIATTSVGSSNMVSSPRAASLVHQLSRMLWLLRVLQAATFSGSKVHSINGDMLRTLHTRAQHCV